ncbi:hypothetical protein IVB44_21435 [Bradyrhizobium sp. 49]|uniref:hypothetical protein n=1 Tax=unclassified Bradyrhizobium TaxID=2631580 RepID=UPI001FF77067|nr:MULTISPECIES: hypothetical protein [unclassified Bradyrhizobium]MCK1266751.1 hypothetical protein [Bradyrhizobium sp. 84]MCK1373530.1 hypothetical protein [Bradyrhizobium sp. 49]
MSGKASKAFILVCFLASPAYGACDQSSDIDPTKTISSISVLLAMPGASAHPISCSAAVKYKDFLFVSGATKIDDKAFDDFKAYQQAMRAQRSALETAIKNAEPNPTRILVDVALLEYGKYATIVACAAPEPTATKAACAVGLGSAMLATYDLANNINRTNENLKVARMGLASHDALYQKELDAKAAQGITPGQARVKAIYNSMCEAIQKQCRK